MPRHKKIAFLLIMPIAAFLWFVGWGFSFVGYRKSLKKIPAKLTVPNELVMFVPTAEKNYII
jgi:hypothetical protein